MVLPPRGARALDGRGQAMTWRPSFDGILFAASLTLLIYIVVT